MTSQSVAEDEPLPSDPLPAGAMVGGRYELQTVLGRGASGVVYVGVDQETKAKVALKVIHREHCHTRQIFARYKREAAILRRIGGSHIVRFLDFLEHDDLLVIVLELVGGISLEKRLREGSIPIPNAIELVIQLCRGLEAAHEAGVIHRDLKPANVMLETPNAAEEFVDSLGKPCDERARILDFGLAKVVHGGQMVTGLTERDMIFGTPEYMAPEQARGDDVDVRCDVYACGVILYEMLTGSVPFTGKTPLATMTMQLTSVLEAPRVRAKERNIPAALEIVLLRCLEKQSEKRYTSVRELRTAIEAATERRVISVHPTLRAELVENDTELNLRRSQIHDAADTLRAAEQLAAENEEKRAAQGAEEAEVDAKLVPKPEPEPKAEDHRWKLVAALAIVGCVVLGVLLALK